MTPTGVENEIRLEKMCSESVHFISDS